MKKLLWIGDAVVASGFARCTHEILNVLKDAWDVNVLGINFLGDPHPYSYKIFPAWPGGDGFGLSRVERICEALNPDVVVVQNDTWNVPEYVKKIPSNIPVIGVMPVDGKNCRGHLLNDLAGAIFWTDFGLLEARAGGYAGPAAVIPLGVDLEIFKPGSKSAARRTIELPEEAREGFIVGNINRNQPRKRLDLTVKYFCEWVKDYKIDDAFLFLHVAPTGDEGYDLAQLFKYHGVKKRLILVQPRIGPGAPENLVVETYRSFDLQVSTTQGEGWGLTTMEGMACGIPQIVPDWAALGEWPHTAVAKVPCTSTIVTPNYINVVGGIADQVCFTEILNELYHDPGRRADLSQRGLTRVQDSSFRWETIGDLYHTALEEFLEYREMKAKEA